LGGRGRAIGVLGARANKCGGPVRKNAAGTMILLGKMGGCSGSDRGVGPHRGSKNADSPAKQGKPNRLLSSS